MIKRIGKKEETKDVITVNGVKYRKEGQFDSKLPSSPIITEKQRAKLIEGMEEVVSITELWLEKLKKGEKWDIYLYKNTLKRIDIYLD